MRRIVGFLALVGLMTGCTMSQQVGPTNRVSALAPAARILLVESDIKFYVLTAGGVPEPQPDWTEKARSNFVSAVRRQFGQHGHSVLTVDAGAADDALNQYQKLHEAVAITMLSGLQLPSKHGAFDYSLGPGVSVLKDRYSADYALFVSYRDYRASGGQQAKAIIAGMFGIFGVSTGGQSGYASLVDLTNGDVVWCRLVGIGTGDLREPDGADTTVSVLFEGIPGG
jgi:hypothetical protein